MLVTSRTSLEGCLEGYTHLQFLAELLGDLLILLAQVLVLLEQSFSQLCGQDEVPLLGKELGVHVGVRVRSTSSSRTSSTTSRLEGVDVIVETVTHCLAAHLFAAENQNI